MAVSAIGPRRRTVGVRGSPPRGQQREQLDGLAESHVVARMAPTPSLRERQPGEPARWYAGACRGALRGISRREPLLGLGRTAVAEPAVGVHLGQRRSPGAPPAPIARAKHLGGGHRPRPLAREELQRGLQVPVCELDPLAATRTRRNFHRASSASSSGESVSSPRPGRSGRTPGPAGPPGSAVPRRMTLDEDRVVSFRPSRALRAQSGISTPNPPPTAAGGFPQEIERSRGVQRDLGGRGPRAARRRARETAWRVPRPASSSSSACPVCGSSRRPSSRIRLRPHVGGGQLRLGSAADWSENSTRQASAPSAPARSAPPRPVRARRGDGRSACDAAVSSLAGSTRRKQVRTPSALAGSAALASQSASVAARAPGRPLVGRVRHLDQGLRAGQGKQHPFCYPGTAGGRPLRAGSRAPGNRARADASARASSMSASSGPGRGACLLVACPVSACSLSACPVLACPVLACPVLACLVSASPALACPVSAALCQPAPGRPRRGTRAASRRRVRGRARRRPRTAPPPAGGVTAVPPQRAPAAPGRGPPGSSANPATGGEVARSSR